MGQAALFVDLENAARSDGGRSPRQLVRWLLDTTLKSAHVDRVTVRRVFADWQVVPRDMLAAFAEERFDAIPVPNVGKGLANASDIALTVNAMDLLSDAHFAHVDVFVVASNDTDFRPLVTRLSSAGRFVVGLGFPREGSRSGANTESYRRMFHEYLLLPSTPIKSEPTAAKGAPPPADKAAAVVRTPAKAAADKPPAAAVTPVKAATPPPATATLDAEPAAGPSSTVLRLRSWTR